METHSIKNALAFPWPSELPVGGNLLHGYAHSPHSPIGKNKGVEVIDCIRVADVD